jgi:hypothetical protein
MRSKILEAIQKLLFANTALKNALSSRIYYDRGPVSSTWPQLVFFDVTETQGYLIDYDSVTVQFSVWAATAHSALQIIEMVKKIVLRLHAGVDISGGNKVFINWSSLLDSGELPGSDQQLHGQFLRIRFNYRGENLGG